MAFLDNSGDIILDAVLTDVGRKRMAAGSFKITKFALGDDEIDYGLYNKSHPSGSAYYDLEILQTPILEAFTQLNASINFGLLTYARTDLLYLPDIKLNETGISINQVNSGGGVIYLCDDSAPIAGVTTSTALDAETGVLTNQIMINGNPLNRFLLFETGLDTSDLEPTSANQATYLTSMGLLDESFTVGFDNRVIKSVYYATGAKFTSDSGASSPITMQANAFDQASTVSLSRETSNFSVTAFPAIISQLYSGGGLPTAAVVNAASALNGPKGTFQCMVPWMVSDLSSTTYSQMGLVNQDIGSGKLYNWIDTVVYIKGQSTNIELQIPIRVIKYVS
ncbi:hypothetical protein CMI47_04030 [Candidatus Pacearchaeota archaeon]|nr:hypothetical protein [Candidatus Pacearchaeota archaeon]|tara:strand:- start:2519 stop:3529 length:1011 start_codon:yes stop_codon:yes gene_type:complete